MGGSNQALMFIAIVCLLSPTLLEVASAFQYRVGDKNGWSVPNNTQNTIYSQWAQEQRFQVGDTLLFVYNANEDSVLQVNSQDDYTNCKTSAAIQTFKDGKTVVNLSHSGPFYFISGNSDNCQKSEKLHVVVMSIRSKKSVSPAPTQVSTSVPASAPTPVSVPAPAPMFTSPAPSPEAMPPTTAAASSTFQACGGALTVLLATILSLSLM